ncbi:TlpA disulfide reductase family protein [uncultured Tenacibaculum sp.]|uniref:TlpA disulfide reductase family protein n=1 Tax=uncultured Tenacibaculum sp. TaxID=174713 RepID=UPI00261DCF0B|nr:TlpA disulfide reductase family protein [uncultured Tenacibaculum sp.]
MKKIILLLVLLSGISCQKKEKDQFDFKIEGEVENGNNLDLTLLIPNDSTQNQINTKIKNGKFSFTGSSKVIQYGEIRFKHDLDANKTNYSFIPVFLEPGKTKISFGIIKSTSDIFKDIVKIKASQGKNTMFYYNEFFKKPTLTDHFSFINDYEKKKDSMHKNVYPIEKKIFFEKFDNVYQTTKSIAYLKFLSLYLQGNFPPFDPDYFSREDKSKLKKILEKTDSKLLNSNVYKEFNFILKSLFDNTKSLKYSNFTLVDIQNKQVELKKIIKKNKYTVLNFWWTGCSPCRKFNQEGNTIYNTLKENKIEIIGVNVDLDPSAWKKSSSTDKINWINLYAGPNSQVQINYQINSFPSKIIFNDKFQIIDFKFEKAEELISLITD